MHLTEQTGGQSSGYLSLHEKGADPVEQGLRLRQFRQPTLQPEHVIGAAAAPKGIDQCVVGGDGAEQVAGGHRSQSSRTAFVMASIEGHCHHSGTHRPSIRAGWAKKKP